MILSSRLLTFLTSVALSVSALCAANPIPKEAQIGGFAIGPQAYSFNRFTAYEAVEKAAQAGAKVIEMYPGQKLSPAKPDAKFHHSMSEADFQEFMAHAKKHGVLPVNYGVVGGADEAEWRKIFEFGQKLGVYSITTEDVRNIDVIEKLAKEFDLNVGYHEHPRRENDPNYRLWDPNYLAELLKGRDARMGVSADTGHWASSGVQPLEALRILKGRIKSAHLKDRGKIGASSTDLVFGTGILDIKALLAELKAQGFDGNIAIEYETNWDNSVPDIKACIDYVRGLAK